MNSQELQRRALCPGSVIWIDAEYDYDERDHGAGRASRQLTQRFIDDCDYDFIRAAHALREDARRCEREMLLGCVLILMLLATFALKIMGVF